MQTIPGLPGVPQNVRQFFEPYLPLKPIPWNAGIATGLITKVFVCSDPREAVAYLSLNHTRYPDLNTLYFFAIGATLPKALQLPKAKTTLLFDSTLLGKLWDIKIACLIRNKAVSITYHNHQCAFWLKNNQFTLGIDEVSLSSFEQASGIRTQIRTSKAKIYPTFLEQFLNQSP
jgi:hypothetical protein